MLNKCYQQGERSLGYTCISCEIVDDETLGQCLKCAHLKPIDSAELKYISDANKRLVSSFSVNPAVITKLNEDAQVLEAAIKPDPVVPPVDYPQIVN